MPHILIISPFFPPSAASGAHRMLGFARHLPKLDWDVSVVASGPIPWEPNDEALAQFCPDGDQGNLCRLPVVTVAATIAVHRSAVQLD